MADPYTTIVTLAIKDTNKEYEIMNKKNMAYIPGTENIILNFLKDLNRKKIGYW